MSLNATESELESIQPAELSFGACFIIAFFLGAVAATFAKCVSAPFERIKLFQQCLYAEFSETKAEFINWSKDRNPVLDQNFWCCSCSGLLGQFLYFKINWVFLSREVMLPIN